MSVFVAAGPAEILRAVQKDRLVLELVEKHFTDLLLKIGGTSVWLKYRHFLPSCSTFFYYTFTTLSGFQTLGEEYTNIVEVDLSLRRIPTFSQRLLMTLADSAGIVFVDYSLKKLHNQISRTVSLPEDQRKKLLLFINILKSLLPFIIHFHHAVFYWNGAYYDIIKRIIGIRYIRSKRWISKDRQLYGFKILSFITFLHLFISALHFIYQKSTVQQIDESHNLHIEIKDCSKCPLCMEPRSNTSCTSCGHLFCWYCIMNWLQTNNQCPICRDVIQSSRIVPLKNYD